MATSSHHQAWATAFVSARATAAVELRALAAELEQAWRGCLDQQEAPQPSSAADGSVDVAAAASAEQEEERETALKVGVAGGVVRVTLGASAAAAGPRRMPAAPSLIPPAAADGSCSARPGRLPMV
jgi:hypothetical protein